MNIRPFHLAIPVKDLIESIEFYENVLGCKRGRKDKQWADYNLFGHQLVLHEKLYEQKIHFQIAPYLRFEGEPGEQLTMFFYDPSGNALEFKSFKNPEQLFAV